LRPVLPAHTASNSTASIDSAPSEELKCDKHFQFFEERAYYVVSGPRVSPGASRRETQQRRNAAPCESRWSKLTAPRKRNAPKCRENAQLLVSRCFALGVAHRRGLFRRMSGYFPPGTRGQDVDFRWKRREPRQPFGCWGSHLSPRGRRAGGISDQDCC
jgi:hypothetical protein